MDGSLPIQSLPIQATPIVFSRKRNEDLAVEITRLSGHMNAATHRWLMLLAEFDDRKGWHDSATQSCAHWLNWKIGITTGAAREKVRVAHALQKLPKISASMEKAELSYYKVRELTRVASPETEDTLLMIAQHGSAHHVETVVRHFRRAKEAQELSREQAQQANRTVSYHFDDDGSLILKARLPAEAGAVFLKALQLSVEEVRSNEPAEGEDVPAGTPTVKSTHRTRRADGLALMAESFLQHGAEAMSGGDKFQVVVHVSEEFLNAKPSDPLTTSPTHDLARCEFEDGPAIAAETARRLACDCSVVRISEDDEGNPLDVGRKTRSIPPALSRALRSRDQGCRFPGCCNKRYTHGHHIQHWANGGETKLRNLISLCYFHHRLVHEGGWSIQVLDDGAFRFLKPNGDALDTSISANPGSDALRITTAKPMARRPHGLSSRRASVVSERGASWKRPARKTRAVNRSAGWLRLRSANASGDA